MQVVAFAPAVDRLRFEGLDFSATPVALLDGPVADLVARLPRGAVVALAVPAEHVPRFAANFGPAQRRLGAGPSSSDRRDFVLVGVVGDSTPARLAYGNDFGGARLTLPAGDGVWGHGRSELELVAETGTAAIRLGGRDLVRTAAGVALAVWAPDGQLLRAAALQAVDGYLVPVPAGPFSAYPLIGTSDGQALAPNAWVDVTPSMGSGSIIVRIPAGGRLELYASDDARLLPRVLEHVGRGPVDMTAVRDAARRRAGSGRSAAPGRRVRRAARPRLLHVACRGRRVRGRARLAVPDLRRRSAAGRRAHRVVRDRTRARCGASTPPGSCAARIAVPR